MLFNITIINPDRAEIFNEESKSLTNHVQHVASSIRT